MAAGIGFLLAIILGNLIYLCIKSYKKKRTINLAKMNQIHNIS